MVDFSITFISQGPNNTTIRETYDRANDEYASATLSNAQLGQYLSQQGFKQFILTNGKQYWGAQPCDGGFCQPYGPSDKPLAANDSKAFSKNGSLAELQARDLAASKKLAEQQAQEAARLKAIAMAHRTRYKGMYIGESASDAAILNSGCSSGSMETPLLQIVRDRKHEACGVIIMGSSEAHVTSIADFIADPFQTQYARLTRLFGRPSPGLYRLLDGDRIPEYTLWRTSDGTRIAARPNSGRFAGGQIVHFTDVIVTR
jgi:hypothetical protein